MKPIIKYRGGKTKEIPFFRALIPKFEGRYIEPFFGGGALYFYLEPEAAIINDINTKLIDFYIGVRDNYSTLRNELDELETIYTANRQAFDALKAQYPNERVEDKNETFYYALRDMFNNIAPKQYSDAALYFYINKTAYSGMIRYNAKGEFNVPFGRYPNLNTHILTAEHSQLLQGAEIFNTDYSNIFNISQPNDFIFLDPPYDCAFSDYGNEEYKDGFNEDSHRRLAQDFRNLPCPAMMIIGRTGLTTELYGDMIKDEYGKNYSVNIRNRFKAGASHIVVCNYELPQYQVVEVHAPQILEPALQLF
ncbi:MAG: Dam family site-specific DNA-(adenine-N6)-methyltransferase [Paludibacteraceae bacterium]|nr:Dam family site-specific DNA-(adenine-N6)-methyltransferase [Paludibacteraceae bacterium]